jgi:SNF2 family DNA or RNA helicase
MLQRLRSPTVSIAAQVPSSSALGTLRSSTPSSPSLSGGKLRVGKLDGRTSASSKAFLQSEFNAGQLDVLVGQIAAMGVSLNLQHGGNRIIVVEEDWSPAVMDQFFARLHRMGQTEHVHVDILRGDNKLEEAVARIAGNKRREHGRVMQQEAVA